MLLGNVKALCRDKGLTLYALEKIMEFSNGSLRKWNMSAPSVDKVKKVADYFGVTVDELLK